MTNPSYLCMHLPLGQIVSVFESMQIPVFIWMPGVNLDCALMNRIDEPLRLLYPFDYIVSEAHFAILVVC